MTAARWRAWCSSADSASSRDCSTPLSVGGHGDPRDPILVHVPLLTVAGDHAGVDQPADELLDVERVAVGSRRRSARSASRAHARRAGGSLRRAALLTRGESEWRSSRTWWSRPSPQRGRRSNSEGLAVATMKTGLPCSCGATASIQSSVASSAQCRSSSSTTTGDSVGEALEALCHERRRHLAQGAAVLLRAGFFTEVDRQPLASTRERCVALGLVAEHAREPAVPLLPDRLRRVAVVDLESA